MDKINYVLRGKEPSTRSRTSQFNFVVVLGIILIVLFFARVQWSRGNIFTAAGASFFVTGSYLIKLGMAKGGKRLVEPFEIRFYDDYLVIFRERYHHDGVNPRMQLEKFYYRDIQRCTWNKVHHQLFVFGMAEITGTDYDEDYKLASEPSYEAYTEHTCTIGTEITQEIDYAREIESHSPVRVDIISL